MQIKKFVAGTLKEAAAEMKIELGNEAMIIGTRIIEGKPELGIRKMFEITAGVEEDGIHFRQEKTGQRNDDRGKFINELAEISKNFNQPVRKQAADSIKENKPKSSLDAELKILIENLYNKDVKRNVVSSIIDQLKKYSSFLHSSNLDNYVLSALSSMIPVSNFELKKSKEPKVLNFVGPTGVGKTTCIAKLAVIAKILHNLDVGLISIDTYRLGAIDQLKIFAEISKTDFLVAYEPSDLQKQINSFRKKDLIFVDTAGRSPRNTEQIKKTKEFLDFAKPGETFLVLSTTSSTKSMIEAADKFGQLDYSSFIFTKIDEAATYGNVVNILNHFNKPVSFLSNGQTIPDDIISANSEFIANMIYTGNYLNVRAS